MGKEDVELKHEHDEETAEVAHVKHEHEIDDREEKEFLRESSENDREAREVVRENEETKKEKGTQGPSSVESAPVTSNSATTSKTTDTNKLSMPDLPDVTPDPTMDFKSKSKSKP